MNANNLIPNEARTPSERRLNAQKAGIASGKARREKSQRLKDLFAAFGVEPLTKELMQEADAVLLAMSDEQRSAFAKNEAMPVYMRRRARLLGAQDDEKAFETSERMLDRAFGKPKQTNDVELKETPPIQIVDAGR